MAIFEASRQERAKLFIVTGKDLFYSLLVTDFVSHRLKAGNLPCIHIQIGFGRVKKY